MEFVFERTSEAETGETGERIEIEMSVGNKRQRMRKMSDKHLEREKELLISVSGTVVVVILNFFNSVRQPQHKSRASIHSVHSNLYCAYHKFPVPSQKFSLSLLEVQVDYRDKSSGRFSPSRVLPAVSVTRPLFFRSPQVHTSMWLRLRLRVRVKCQCGHC